MVTKELRSSSTQMIMSRLDALEQAVFGRKTLAKPSAVKKTKNLGLPGHIMALRESGYFKQPKTSQEVHAKLQPSYACEQNRVTMALHRMQGRKELRVTTKKVNGEKEKAYVW